MNDQSHDRQIDNEIALIPYQIIRKERKACIVESGYGMVKCFVKAGSHRKIPGKPDEEKEGSKGFRDEGEPEDRLGNDDEIPSGGVKEGRLDNLSSLEGDPPAHQNEKDRGESDDPKASNLYEKHGDHLTQCGKVLRGIHHNKPCHTDGRGRGEEGIDKTEVSCWGRKRKPEENSAQKNDPCKT